MKSIWKFWVGEERKWVKCLKSAWSACYSRSKWGKRVFLNTRVHWYAAEHLKYLSGVTESTIFRCRAAKIRVIRINFLKLKQKSCRVAVTRLWSSRRAVTCSKDLRPASFPSLVMSEMMAFLISLKRKRGKKDLLEQFRISLLSRNSARLNFH